MTFMFLAVLMGVFATLAIDVWASLLKTALGLPVTNWALVGRWLGHLMTGTFRHDSIAAAPPVKHELVLGWVFHYVIGVVYALLYLLIVVALLQGVPSLSSALLFGLATLVAPWFVLQPGLGLGVFASQAPQPNLLRVLNLLTHALFGTALYLAWAVITLALQYGA